MPLRWAPQAAAVPASWRAAPCQRLKFASSPGTLSTTGPTPGARSRSFRPRSGPGLPPRGRLRLTGLELLFGLGVSSAFLTRGSCRCLVVPRCDFNLHLSDNY